MCMQAHISRSITRVMELHGEERSQTVEVGKEFFFDFALQKCLPFSILYRCGPLPLMVLPSSDNIMHRDFLSHGFIFGINKLKTTLRQDSSALVLTTCLEHFGNASLPNFICRQCESSFHWCHHNMARQGSLWRISYDVCIVLSSR